MTTQTGTPKTSQDTEYFEDILRKIYWKAKNEPSAITTEDARRLSENLQVSDQHAAAIVSAVECYATANEAMHDADPNLGQAPQTSLLTVVKDFKVAVDANPDGVNDEVLKTAQAIVSRMQKIIGPTKAPHPELEAELEEEIAKIEPKVAEGTVTMDEANHLHSLEARAHGHTEKGGITSIAQSVAAKRERQLSLSSGSAPASTARSRANSMASTTQHLSDHEKSAGTSKVETTVEPEIRIRSQPSKSSISGSVQPAALQKRREGLSDSSNISPYATEEDFKHRKEQSQHDKELNLKIAEMTIEPKLKHDPKNVKVEDAAYVQSREQRAHGHVDKGGLASKAMSSAHKKENSQNLTDITHKRENSQPLAEMK